VLVLLFPKLRSSPRVSERADDKASARTSGLGGGGREGGAVVADQEGGRIILVDRTCR
jgi:hypothetical protein